MPRPKSKSAGIKHTLGDDAVSQNAPAERPAKKAKLLDDTDDEGESDHGGVQLKVNAEYAQRFEHNKKRAERHRRMLGPHQSRISHN